MPYCEPHHAARVRIVDFEILRLELRAATRRPKPLGRPDERGTGRVPRTDGSTPPRVA
jgi:hypothetical protein